MNDFSDSTIHKQQNSNFHSIETKDFKILRKLSTVNRIMPSISTSDFSMLSEDEKLNAYF